MNNHAEIIENHQDMDFSKAESSFIKNDYGAVVLIQGYSFTFVSFGLMVGLGALLSSLHILFYLGSYQILAKPAQIYQLGLAVALGAPLSAYVITRVLDLKTWLSGEKNFFEYIRTVSFGLWGGLVGGLLILIGFAALTQTPLLALFDSFAVGIPLAQVLGRLGCLNYGCCHGRECSSDHQLGIRYSNPQTKVLRYNPELKGKRLYPTQIYSVLGNLIIYTFILILWLNWDARPVGTLAAVYMSLHGLKRFSVEFLRGESPRVYFKGLTLWQWFSMGFMVTGLGLLTFVINSTAAVGVGDFTLGFQSMQSALGILILVSIIFGLAYGTHGRKIGSW